VSRKRSILIVDDEHAIRTQLSWALRDDYEVLEASNREEALDRVRSQTVDLVLLDLRFPPADTEISGGRGILEAIRTMRPGLPVIIMTGDHDRETAVEMVARGAFDFFRKPIDLPELRVVVRRAVRMHELEQEVRRLRSDLQASYGLENIVGDSPRIKQTLRLVRRVADTGAAVLITGESGTGKELVARGLHELSGRREAAFVALNCSAIPPSLIDDELFGHEKGAFTGAVDSRLGKFEYASGGTLFLDEIGDLPEPVQVKLLRVLQESEIQRLGSNATVEVDVRLITATHQDLLEKCREGSFREDLYYRLNVVQIPVPPLRERAGDVALLVEHFLDKYGSRGERKTVAPAALEQLTAFDWPGNVRQLENVIHSLCVTCEGARIGEEALPPEIRGTEACPGVSADGKSLPEMERDLIWQALERTGGNRTRAAKLLGISRHVLLGKLKKHGLTD
jgi:putative PEP-CTERM system response regulator